MTVGGTTQPFSDLIGHIREMHITTHGTADLIAELMIRVKNLETLVKGKEAYLMFWVSNQTI